jgi:hypothetical protein
LEKKISILSSIREVENKISNYALAVSKINVQKLRDGYEQVKKKHNKTLNQLDRTMTAVNHLYFDKSQSEPVQIKIISRKNLENYKTMKEDLQELVEDYDILLSENEDLKIENKSLKAENEQLKQQLESQKREPEKNLGKRKFDEVENCKNRKSNKKIHFDHIRIN